MTIGRFNLHTRAFRRASCYYVTAAVAGPLFIVIILFVLGMVLDPEWRSNKPPVDLLELLAVWFILGSLYGGAVIALVNAFFLRRVARRNKLDKLWQWAGVGALLSIVSVWGLGGLTLWLESTLGLANVPDTLAEYLSFVFLAPVIVSSWGFLGVALVSSAGAATALLLYYVDRAFTRETIQRANGGS